MKDKKERKEIEDKNVNTHEKFFWIIGIAIIIFMILLLGSLIGLKMTRDKIGNISFIPFEKNSNYEVLEDGTMRNINDNILRTEIDVDNIRFSHFAITQKNNQSGEEETYDVDFYFDIENMDEEVEDGAIFLVTLKDSKGNKLIDFNIQTSNLQSKEPMPFRQRLDKSCVDAADISVERIK